MTRIESYTDQMARLFPVRGLEHSAKPLMPRTVTWQVVDSCNLQCTYCYQINKKNHEMSWDVAKRFCDLVLSNNGYIDPSNSSGLIMEFIGGEPFLAVDLMDKICEYMIGKMIEMQHPWATRYMVSVCSNGVLYFDEKVQKFLEKHRNHLSFSISIDGCKELHDACRVFPDGSGSYDIAMAGVKHFRQHFNGLMGSKMTLAPGNIEYTFKAVKSLIENGYDEINLNCVYEEGWTAAHAKILYEELKKVADYMALNDKVKLSIFDERFFQPKDENDEKNWCGGLGEMLSCDWKGDLYPCIRYMESSLGDERESIKIGNVFRGILKTKEEQELMHCMECVTRRSQSTDECYYCPIAEGCSWCFPAGSKVATPTGERNIEELKVGDEVLSFSEGETQTQKVEKVFSREANNIIKVNGFAVTANHPFLVKREGKTLWSAVKEGDEIFNFKEEKWEEVEISEKFSKGKVFNLMVAETHNFIANGYVVHNCSAYNYQDTGSFNKRATHICIMHKARALANAYFWNLKFLLEEETSKVFKIWIPDDWALEVLSGGEKDKIEEAKEELERLKVMELLNFSKRKSSEEKA